MIGFGKVRVKTRKSGVLSGRSSKERNSERTFVDEEGTLRGKVEGETSRITTESRGDGGNVDVRPDSREGSACGEIVQQRSGDGVTLRESIRSRQVFDSRSPRNNGGVVRLEDKGLGSDGREAEFKSERRINKTTNGKIDGEASFEAREMEAERTVAGDISFGGKVANRVFEEGSGVRNNVTEGKGSVINSVCVARVIEEVAEGGRSGRIARGEVEIGRINVPRVSQVAVGRGNVTLVDQDFDIAFQITDVEEDDRFVDARNVQLDQNGLIFVNGDDSGDARVGEDQINSGSGREFEIKLGETVGRNAGRRDGTNPVNNSVGVVGGAPRVFERARNSGSRETFNSRFGTAKAGHRGTIQVTARKGELDGVGANNVLGSHAKVP